MTESHRAARTIITGLMERVTLAYFSYDIACRFKLMDRAGGPPPGTPNVPEGLTNRMHGKTHGDVRLRSHSFAFALLTA